MVAAFCGGLCHPLSFIELGLTLSGQVRAQAGAGLVAEVVTDRSRGALEVAGHALALGIDPMPYLRCDDPLERLVFERLVESALEIQDVRDGDLATKIINRLAEALDGGHGGG